MKSDPDLICIAAMLTLKHGGLYGCVAEDKAGMQDFPLGSRPPLISASRAGVTSLSEIRKCAFCVILTDDTDRKVSLKTDCRNGHSLFEDKT